MIRQLLALAAWLLIAAATAATTTVMLTSRITHGSTCLPGWRLDNAEGLCVPHHHHPEPTP